MPPRSKSSRQWLREHFDDPYVQRAQAEGYRSRAVYKLLELDERNPVFRPGQTVVDLGAAPGGWSQVARARLGGSGRVIATDILAIDPLPGVEFLQGDFREQSVLDDLLRLIGETGADLVLSDMAPNMSGVTAVDQPRAMILAELALDLAMKVLRPGGGLILKLFQGQGSDAFLAELRAGFERVGVRKPKASRPRSREVYVVASGRKL
ncbi:23S rRNA (uridine(2552)-2'-O)-methyltransferase RlmE [Acidihalobacter prosperus]|uniref:Ribosomal RNA large subunit methyltransferase E n=1 Tax=Acidihalobacter prosperus TaxID=160660 RepID=A0A1A6C701_9GAMM|nr:23S rRNA (uridine(2552)-2'-O)-methyltransferase RlmE [Acidihalobacter prosperus]OBS10338.1 23S rRNA methyltransferase [Acidihalobacter prosperus]